MNGYDILNALNGTDEKYITMSEDFHKSCRRVSKTVKISVGAVAAAAVMTVSIGAYAYTRLMHRDSVEMYLGNADRVEASGNVENQVMENGHIRITLDTVLSDGYTAMAVVTLNALDDYGRNYINYHPSIMLRRTDTGEAVFPSGGGGMDDWTEQIMNDTIKYYHTINLTDKDISCGYEMIFYSNGLFSMEDWEKAGGKRIMLDENMIPVDNPLGYDFIATISFEKNVDTVILTGENGKEIILSQFELISEYGDIWDGLPETMLLIKNDGTKEEVDYAKLSGTGSDMYFTVMFGKFIWLDEYNGVEINGAEYLKLK